MLMSACLEKHGSREFCRCRKIQAITGGGKEMDQNVNRSYLREGVLGIIYIYIFFLVLSGFSDNLCILTSLTRKKTL